jgi:uncharacterized DUF497 family protein
VIFSWNAANIVHIAKHGIAPEEAEEVILRAKPPWPEVRKDGRRRVWGRTNSGRLLQVIFIFPADEDVDAASLNLAGLIAWSDGEDRVVYVIHARELEEDEKRQYSKRSRRS